jgi:DNA-binding response OmpR family regulator
VKAPVLLLYGEEYANLALADELTLDGYEVRRASDTATLRAACHTREIDVLILGQAARRGCGLEVLRQLRAGALAPQAEPGLRTLWMSPNGELSDVLRGFEAGADDVIRTPYDYPELRGVNFNSRGSPDFNSWSQIRGFGRTPSGSSRQVSKLLRSQ